MVKIVCMTQVYNQNSIVGWDGKTNIERFMESISSYCDALVAFDDGSTDGSREIITGWSGDFELQIPANEVNTPDREGFHRARGLEHCKRLGADWVLCLDVDEVFEKRAQGGALRAVCRLAKPQYRAIAFNMRDMWRTDRYIRLDNGWSSSAGVRLFRLTNDISYDTTLGVRSTLTPEDMVVDSASALKIIHHGYSTDEAILSKYKRFSALGLDLAEHLDDSNIRLCDTNPDWLNTPLTGPCIEVYNEQVRELLS